MKSLSFKTLVAALIIPALPPVSNSLALVDDTHAEALTICDSQVVTDTFINNKGQICTVSIHLCQYPTSITSDDKALSENGTCFCNESQTSVDAYWDSSDTVRENCVTRKHQVRLLLAK